MAEFKLKETVQNDNLTVSFYTAPDDVAALFPEDTEFQIIYDNDPDMNVPYTAQIWCDSDTLYGRWRDCYTYDEAYEQLPLMVASYRTHKKAADMAFVSVMERWGWSE